MASSGNSLRPQGKRPCCSQNFSSRAKPSLVATRLPATWANSSTTMVHRWISSSSSSFPPISRKLPLHQPRRSFATGDSYHTDTPTSGTSSKNRVLELYDIAEGKAAQRPGDPTVVFSFDEFGPLNLLPRPGKQWAPVVSRKKKGSTASPRRHRIRATYKRNILSKERLKHLACFTQWYHLIVVPSNPVLGVDVGGVLAERLAGDSDTSFFGGRPMATPVVAGALDAVTALSAALGGRVHIVSKAGPRTSELSRRWLGLHGFLGDDKVPQGQVHFVRRREDKHPVCERLEITHFVDDMVDVLSYLQTVPQRYLFTGGHGARPVSAHVAKGIEGITVVATWPELWRHLLGSITTVPGDQ